MVDWLAGLMERHPRLADVPLIAVLLLLCVILFVFGFRRAPNFWPGRLGAILAVCYKVGCGLLMFYCLLGSVHFGMQASLARHGLSTNPVLLVGLIVSWLLVVVPCMFRDENKKREKRKPA